MRSMTGYGRCQHQRGEWECTVELRAVNHRYLDIACRLPRSLSFLEDLIRRQLSPLQRGHVDVYVTVSRLGGTMRQVDIDEALAQSYVDAAHRLAKKTGCRDNMSTARLLMLEGVASLTEAAMDEESVSTLCAVTVSDAVEQLDEMRRREGVSLREDLSKHLDVAAAIRQLMLVRAPQVVEEYRQRLCERLARMDVEPVEPQRLAQEVALMADKCAIDEELSRLDSHITQLRRYLDTDGEIGKKMDFLIQEMNREANTIGSKANDAQLAQWVVDLKSEIEKLREQVQNAV